MAVLLSVEILGLLGIIEDWPILGDFYEGYSALSLVSAIVACASLLIWYVIARSAKLSANEAAALRPILIPHTLAWFVLAGNFLATIFIGYGSVGYAGGSFGFLLTILPLEPLLIAYVSQRQRFDWPLLGMYAVLGLIRGWTGHLFLLLLIYLLLATRRQRYLTLLGVVFGSVVIYEPLMHLRALVRGFDDSTGFLLYRIVSRIAMTPISDYTLNNLLAILGCDGIGYISWAEELLFSVVPRSLFGVGETTSIHGCLAIVASGDPNIGLSFSTTLAVKAALVWLTGPIGFTAFCVAVYLILAGQIYLAKRTLGSGGYIYVAMFAYSFFLSGVMRDLAIPFYFLGLLYLLGLPRRPRRVIVHTQNTQNSPPILAHQTNESFT